MKSILSFRRILHYLCMHIRYVCLYSSMQILLLKLNGLKIQSINYLINNRRLIFLLKKDTVDYGTICNSRFGYLILFIILLYLLYHSITLFSELTDCVSSRCHILFTFLSLENTEHCLYRFL